MSTYRVTSSIVASFWEEIEAASSKEAREKIENGDGEGIPILCHHCSQKVTIDDFNEILEVDKISKDDEEEEEEGDDDDNDNDNDKDDDE